MDQWDLWALMVQWVVMIQVGLRDQEVLWALMDLWEWDLLDQWDLEGPRVQVNQWVPEA